MGDTKRNSVVKIAWSWFEFAEKRPPKRFLKKITIDFQFLVFPIRKVSKIITDSAMGLSKTKYHIVGCSYDISIAIYVYLYIYIYIYNVYVY